MKPGDITQDQSAAVALLADPATHGGITPDRIDTHAAMVFLAGDRAYKLKRAVWFPFLDFSTVDKRRAACEAELTLNRRTAPALYLDVRPLARDAGGTLSIGGAGEAVDWVVIMRRFDQDALFDRMAERGALTTGHMRHLADTIADFHDKAEIRRDRGGYEAMRWVVDDNIEELAGQASVFPAGEIESLRDRSAQALRRCRDLLDMRCDSGHVRHCHGDLHLRNILLWDEKPTLFDCLEFDETLASIDVLYDLAYLLMDLEHRDRRDLANLAFNRYLQRSGDLGGLPALPLFLSCRAAIRAKVEGSAAAHQGDDAEAGKLRASARAYLDRAIAVLAPRDPRLIGIGGESGSGKSTVAALMAPSLGGAPGALILRSDVTRKRLFSHALEERLPPEAYSPEATARTYGRLIEAVKAGLAAGMTVIADAVFADPAERNALEDAAREAGVPFSGLWLDVPLEVRITRVGHRTADASDATADFLRDHPAFERGPMKWTRLDARGDADTVASAARQLLDTAMRA